MVADFEQGDGAKEIPILPVPLKREGMGVGTGRA